ncbi:hypothetical protein F5887DRAFT_1073352 [Amanita rubescens]|nr:hypothetical protein F5887DRAFT_1073352 [Amanita rubescens]
MARLNYVIIPESPINFPVQRKGWRSAKRNAKAPNGVNASVAVAYKKHVREDIRARMRGRAAASWESVEMDVDPDEDELRGLALLRQTFGPHPSFNDVSHSNMPPAPYVRSAVPEVYNNMFGYSPMPHQDHEISPHSVPVILGYAPEYREDMDIDAEGFTQAPVNPHPGYLGVTAMPGNSAFFNGPGIDVTPYDPNEPYFNTRPQVVPRDVFAANGMVPYDPHEPYFHAGLHMGNAGMHNPAFNVHPHYHVPHAVPDNHFLMNNVNVPQPPVGGAPWPENYGFGGGVHYPVQPAVPLEPIAGMYNPAFNVPPLYHAPQVTPDNYFLMNNVNVPLHPMDNAPWPMPLPENNGFGGGAQNEGFLAQNYPPEPQEAVVPVIAREVEHLGNRNELHAELFGDDEDDEEEEEDEPAFAQGLAGDEPPWEPDEDDDELQIIIY